jgi:1-acyl-sn-glycerol-3-phosphate acyltransferase
VTIKFGEPVHVTGRSMDSSTLRAITDEVMSRIQRLTGQEYVGRYAPRRTAPGEKNADPGEKTGGDSGETR